MNVIKYTIIAMSVVFIVVGTVIFVAGFMKGILGMCIAGFTLVWTFSIMAAAERITRIEKKLEKKYKMNKLVAICVAFTIVGSIMLVIGFWEMKIWETGIMGLTIMWASSIVAINERISEIEKKLEKKYKLNIIVATCAASAIVGGVITGVGFLEGKWERCIIGIILMWASSIGAINERINQIEKK